MEVKTISFSEALNNIINNKTEYLIRGAWLKGVDFEYGIVNLSLVEYIKLEKANSLVPNDKDKLIHWKHTSECSRGKEMVLRTEDVLATDWIDLTTWKVVKNNKEVNEIKRLKTELKEATYTVAYLIRLGKHQMPLTEGQVKVTIDLNTEEMLRGNRCNMMTKDLYKSIRKELIKQLEVPDALADNLKLLEVTQNGISIARYPLWYK